MVQEKRLTLYETRGIQTQVMDCLSGKNGKHWMKILSTVLIEKKNPFPDFSDNDSLCIHTGDINSLEELINRIGSYRISEDAMDMIVHSEKTKTSIPFVLTKKSSTISAVIVTPEELGFTEERIPIEDIYEVAQVFGLKLLPVDFGPLYLTNAKVGDYSFKKDEVILCASMPIEDFGTDSIFAIQNSSEYGLQLFSVIAKKGRLYSKSTKIAFKYK